MIAVNDIGMSMSDFQQTDLRVKSLQHLNLHIILVDDEPGFRAVTMNFLRKAGLRVTTAKDGAEAIQFMTAYQKHGIYFDLLITDSRISNMSSLTLLHQIKSHNLELPVIVLSGCMEDALFEELKIMHLHKFMTKPINPHDLLQNIIQLTTVNP